MGIIALVDEATGFPNLAAAVSLHFFHYNVYRVHKTLGTTPRLAAGVTDHVWTLEKMIGLLEDAERTAVRRGSCSKTRAIKREPRFKLTDAHLLPSAER